LVAAAKFLVAAAKFLVAATKKLFVVPYFVAVTIPFFSVKSERSRFISMSPYFAGRLIDFRIHLKWKE